MADEPVTLLIQCPNCGQAVTLYYKPIAESHVDAWTCPHPACLTIHLIDLRGAILASTAVYTEMPR